MYSTDAALCVCSAFILNTIKPNMIAYSYCGELIIFASWKRPKPHDIMPFQR